MIDVLPNAPPDGALQEGIGPRLLDPRPVLRVHVVDPPAYTPPYDRALCAALAADPERPQVTLVTSAFRHGEVPPAAGYAVQERFYGQAAGPRRALRHVPDMLAWRRAAAREADVVHLQWAALAELDPLLLPRRPLVVTAHDVLTREGARRFQHAGQRRLYRRADAVVVHSQHGRRRLLADPDLDPARVHVLPHGAFTDLAHLAPQRPPELPDHDRPVALLFGLLRAYKGIDVLLDAWTRMGAAAGGAELWLVGARRMALPEALPPGVRLVDRFVTQAEAAWCLRRADVVTLPYREIDQSGVLFAALGLGRALLLSDAGGFPEIAPAEHVPAGDAGALASALARLLHSPEARARLQQAAADAAQATYAWSSIARRHLELYATLPR